MIPEIYSVFDIDVTIRVSAVANDTQTANKDECRNVVVAGSQWSCDRNEKSRARTKLVY